MKNKVFHIILTMTTVVVLIANIACYVSDSFFDDIKSLPRGDFLFASMSPTGEYTIRMYNVSAGKTLGGGIRGELICIETKEITNVYWQAGVNTAMVSWISDVVVSINDNNVDVTGKPYDWRNEFGPEALPVQGNGF
ncbi:MAG: DUF5412 family protein [Oscillospiraceae bacterium]